MAGTTCCREFVPFFNLIIIFVSEKTIKIQMTLETARLALLPLGVSDGRNFEVGLSVETKANDGKMLPAI
jgi:hypothetical protein